MPRRWPRASTLRPDRPSGVPCMAASSGLHDSDPDRSAPAWNVGRAALIGSKCRPRHRRTALCRTTAGPSTGTAGSVTSQHRCAHPHPGVEHGLTGPPQPDEPRPFAHGAAGRTGVADRQHGLGLDHGDPPARPGQVAAQHQEQGRRVGIGRRHLTEPPTGGGGPIGIARRRRRELALEGRVADDEVEPVRRPARPGPRRREAVGLDHVVGHRGHPALRRPGGQGLPGHRDRGAIDVRAPDQLLDDRHPVVAGELEPGRRRQQERAGTARRVADRRAAGRVQGDAIEGDAHEAVGDVRRRVVDAAGAPLTGRQGRFVEPAGLVVHGLSVADEPPAER